MLSVLVLPNSFPPNTLRDCVGEGRPQRDDAADDCILASKIGSREQGSHRAAHAAAQRMLHRSGVVTSVREHRSSAFQTFALTSEDARSHLHASGMRAAGRPRVRHTNEGAEARA
eukprot:6190958-Pleurochrysis_carterae.AAC.5